MSDIERDKEEVREIARLWWAPAGLGVISVIAGAIVITKPDNSLKTLAVIAGVFILLDGIGELVTALSRQTSSRGLVAVLGTLNVVIGVLLIRHPVTGVQAIALLLGIWLIAAGVVRFVMAFEHHSDRTGRIVVAVIQAGFGIAIASSAHIGFATLALLVGLWFIVNGLAMIVLGIALRVLRHPRPQPAAAT